MNAKQRYQLCATALHYYWNDYLKPQVGPNSTEDDRNKLNDYFFAFKRMEQLAGMEFENAPKKFGKGEWKAYLKVCGGK